MQPGSLIPADAEWNLHFIDRWIRGRLQEVIEECRAAYAAYEFHRVYHTLNQFCAVDLSSLYVDITKDRMYCDAPDSPRRRATQMAMHEIFDALCRLLAPILVFTAEEAWGYLGSNGSVHLQLFPESQGNLRDSVVREEIEELLKLRGVIGQAIEKARQEKLIGNALEAAVVLHCDERFATSLPREELEEFFILSDLKLEPAKEPSASITKTPNKKCALLAAPADRRHNRGASRVVRSLRGSRGGARVRVFLFLTLPLYALDQITKYLVLRFIDPYGPHPILIPPDFFELVHVTNTGAAFGSFRNNNGFFIALSCIALVVVTVLLLRREPRDPWRRVALGLLMAGVLGNLTDRLLHGHVIDFLLFNLHVRFADPWPAFNVADSCICIAVVCFMIYSFRDSRRSRNGKRRVAPRLIVAAMSAARTFYAGDDLRRSIDRRQILPAEKFAGTRLRQTTRDVCYPSLDSPCVHSDVRQ